MEARIEIPGYGATIDAVIALGRFLEREWGAYGRRMSVVGLSDGAAIGECVHMGDGSRWWVACDRDGSRLVHGDSFQSVYDQLAGAAV